MSNHRVILNRRRLKKRRQLVVNRRLQCSIIMSVSWPMTIALLVTFVILAFYCIRLGREALSANAELPSLLPMFLTTISFMLMFVGYFIFNALKFSHRIAGPMHQLGMTLKAVREGNLKCRARLRRADFLHQTADDLNDFLDWLEEHPPQGLEAVGRLEGKKSATAVACPRIGAEL